MIVIPVGALNATGATRSRESAPVCAPANSYTALHLHSALGEFLRYWDSKLILCAKLFPEEPRQAQSLVR